MINKRDTYRRTEYYSGEHVDVDMVLLRRCATATTTTILMKPPCLISIQTSWCVIKRSPSGGSVQSMWLQQCGYCCVSHRTSYQSHATPYGRRHNVPRTRFSHKNRRPITASILLLTVDSPSEAETSKPTRQTRRQRHEDGPNENLTTCFVQRCLRNNSRLATSHPPTD